MVFTLDEREYSDTIENAYNFASHELLNLLWVEKQLVIHKHTCMLPSWTCHKL